MSPLLMSMYPNNKKIILVSCLSVLIHHGKCFLIICLFVVQLCVFNPIVPMSDCFTVFYVNLS